MQNNLADILRSGKMVSLSPQQQRKGNSCWGCGAPCRDMTLKGRLCEDCAEFFGESENGNQEDK